ncbi:6-bladed beta-propeller [Pleurocapsales cyanobacterium LEGE 10410]|nr:6-bladed beta-propeller [Pleurocapsales cyanobacterium LEGE 10410]
MQRLLLFIFSALFIAQCSKNSIPEKAEFPKQPQHVFILDKIPEHIQEIKNLTIFPGDSEPLYEIELLPEQTYGETGEPYLTQVTGSAVDDHGRVIILNRASNYDHFIYVYSDDGTYHTQMGGPGRGPGEYGFVYDMQAKNGKVFVRDETSQRLSIYNTSDFSFDHSMLKEQLAIRDHETFEDLNAGLIFPRKDGNYLVTFSQGVSGTEHTYLLMDTNGNVMNFEPIVFPNSLWIRTPGKPMSPSLGLGHMMGQTLTALSGEDALYSIWTMDFLIRKYDSNGIYKSAIFYPLMGLPFDLDEYAKTAPFGYSARDIEEGIANMGIKLPETNPVLSDLKVDDENRIWAAVPMDPQRENYEWWILDETGELLAKLQRPREKTIFDIKNGNLYAKEIDEETDAEYVVKYRIELTERQ